MSAPALRRRGLPPMSAGVAAPADKRFRRPDHRPTRRRRAARLAVRGAAGLVVLGVVAMAAMWLARTVVDSSWLRVHHLVVSGTTRLTPASVETMLAGMRRQSILRVDFEQFRRKVLSSPWVADVTLWRRLPSTVEVRVRERAPFALARVGERLHLIDAEGVLLDEYGPTYGDVDLMIVSGLVPLRVTTPTASTPLAEGAGRQADLDRVRLARRFIESLAAAPSLRDRVSEIDVSNARDVAVILDGESAVLHLGDTRFIERLNLYLDLAPSLGRELGVMESVDLRFDERVFVKPGAPRRGVK